jgi:ribosomal protein S27AE
MGFLDRIRQKQAETEARNERVREAGGHVIGAVEEVGAALRVLQGTCPRCGAVMSAQSEQPAMQVTCTSCQSSTVTLS